MFREYGGEKDFFEVAFVFFCVWVGMPRTLLFAEFVPFLIMLQKDV